MERTEEELAYEYVIARIAKAERALEGISKKEAVQKVLTSYRTLLTVMLFGIEEVKKEFASEKGYHIWTSEEVMKYPRFDVRPYSFYGLVHRATFEGDPDDEHKGQIEIMDILPGFACVSVPPAHFLQEMQKIYRDVTGMTPVKLQVLT